MLRKLLLTFLFMAFSATYVLAQNGAVEGTVMDNNNETIPGANVLLVESNQGTATGVDGNYSIDNVEPGTYTLRVTFVGFSTYNEEVTVGSGETVELNIQLSPDTFGLDEVVVTGVGSGTETKKLGFAVGKVGGEDLDEVPATDAANALRGKVPGISIVSASGDPSSSPTIRLRGSTSITGDNSPLIIVDGVITGGDLSDINMEDVESMEVVKGAAAASIYGSLAGNGVIQIRTKRNAEGTTGPQFTFRTEYGFSELAKDYPVATKHPYPTNNIELTDNGKYVESWANATSYDSDRRFDNDFPVLYDNVEAIFSGNPYNSNYISIANSSKDVNYKASYQGLRQEGVIEPADPYERDNVRLNADYSPNEKFDAQFSVSYINANGPRYNEQGQGNFFYSALTAMPYMDMTERDEGGDYSHRPTGYEIQDSNWQNPLYTARNRTFAFERDRIIGGATLTYNITDNFSVNGRQSMDKTYRTNETFYPKGFEDIDPQANTTLGQEYRESINNSVSVSELWAQYEKQLEDINISATAKFLHEDRSYESFDAFGYDYPVPGIRNMSSLSKASYDIDSYQEEIKATNYFLNLDLDYKDKIIMSGLIRRDGSSLFGEDARWNTYYRGSIAYRITEDIDLNNIDEWKVRASYGTSGNRPPFEAQYETFNATASGISPDVLGNSEIKPSTIAELELGTNITFLDRFNFEFNYAETNTKDDYLLVPLPANSGYSSQWQNVGEVESTTFEANLSGRVLSAGDFTWNASTNWSRTRQEITDLGPVPPYTRSLAGVAVDLFRVEEGQPFGTMYGSKALTSLDQLTVQNGTVLNDGVDTNGDGTLTVDDYEVNEDGYVVPAGTHGTPDEQITYAVNENGETEVTSIGNTQPDFQMGLTNSFKYKGFSLYTMLEWVEGPDVYNYTKQLLYFNNRHKEQQEFGSQGYDVAYADGSSAIYNGGEASSYFVEDASYIKLREVALSYTLSNDMLGSLGNAVDRIKLSVSGTNLVTWTDYSGWDPEVALRTNSTNFRIDEYSYPNFRKYMGSVEIRF